jgi:flavin-dependent dehydrogenase
MGPLPPLSSASYTDGCRVYARRLPESVVSDGVIAAGDAFTTCGMLTNVAAIKSGEVAAEVAAAAISRGDVSATSLRDYDRRALRMPMVQGMKWMHNILFEASMKLSDKDMNDLFGILRHLRLGALMRGGATAWIQMVWFYVRTAYAMGRRPDLKPFLVP